MSFSTVFYWMLNISILGTLTGGVVLLLRSLKKLPRYIACLLWGAAFLRLWLPFSPPSPYSLSSLLSKYAIKTTVVYYETWSLGNCLRDVKSYFPIEYKTDLLENVYRVSSLIWAVIAAAAVLTACALYALTKAELKSAQHVRDNIYASDKITAPAVYGIFRPHIILPCALMEGDIDFILLHERVHIRRGDNLFRALAILTCCLHWFNPFVWIFLKIYLADTELACDAKVLKRLGGEETAQYASAVLSASTGKAFFAPAFGGAKTRVRIEHILSYKKLTVFSSLSLLTLAAAVAYILLTNAAG